MKQAFDDRRWVFEMKYDGFRALLYKEGDKCKFVSKKNIEYRRFKDVLADVCEELPVQSAIFDGELAVFDVEGRPIFRDLLSRKGVVFYAAFDILWLNGDDIRDLPLTKRKLFLKHVLKNTTRIFGVDYVSEFGINLFEAIKFLDLEGIVAKRKADPYSSTTRWLKIKNPKYSQKQGRGKIFNK